MKKTVFIGLMFFSVECTYTAEIPIFRVNLSEMLKPNYQPTIPNIEMAVTAHVHNTIPGRACVKLSRNNMGTSSLSGLNHCHCQRHQEGWRISHITLFNQAGDRIPGRLDVVHDNMHMHKDDQQHTITTVILNKLLRLPAPLPKQSVKKLHYTPLAFIFPATLIAAGGAYIYKKHKKTEQQHAQAAEHIFGVMRTLCATGVQS